MLQRNILNFKLLLVPSLIIIHPYYNFIELYNFKSHCDKIVVTSGYLQIIFKIIKYIYHKYLNYLNYFICVNTKRCANIVKVCFLKMYDSVYSNRYFCTSYLQVLYRTKQSKLKSIIFCKYLFQRVTLSSTI